MNDQKVLDAAAIVRDAENFVAFLEVLRVSWEDAVRAEKEAPSSPYTSMHGWMNTNIGSFLEAAVAGGTDKQFGLKNGVEGEATAWKQAAEIILLGRIYE